MVAERRGRLTLRSDLFKERRDSRVSLTSPRPWQRRVRHIPDDHVLEAELLLTLQPGDRFSPDEVPTLQRVQQLRQTICVRTQASEGAGPEDLPDHRRVEQDQTLLRWQRIQPRSDDPPNARGELGCGNHAPLAQ